MIPTASTVTDDSTFTVTVERVCSHVVRSIREHDKIESGVDKEPDSIYVKAVDGTILLSNATYDKLFAGGVSPLGRSGHSYLTDSIAALAGHSDQMILDGCSSVQFEHVGHDTAGRQMRMLTHKRSLLGLGHPTLAILGITRVVEVLNENGGPERSLRRLWSQFNEMDELDRNIAIGLARGNSVTSIAEANGVTKKTIENHRSAILRRLGFDSPIGVIKLIVRLQENGFGDFGV